METNQRHKHLSVRSAAHNCSINMHGLEVSVESVKTILFKNTARNVLDWCEFQRLRIFV
jgi:hypothetical protein